MWMCEAPLEVAAEFAARPKGGHCTTALVLIKRKVTLVVSNGTFRSFDLWVRSPPRYHCATLLTESNAQGIHKGSRFRFQNSNVLSAPTRQVAFGEEIHVFPRCGVSEPTSGAVLCMRMQGRYNASLAPVRTNTWPPALAAQRRNGRSQARAREERLSERALHRSGKSTHIYV